MNERILTVPRSHTGGNWESKRHRPQFSLTQTLSFLVSRRRAVYTLSLAVTNGGHGWRQIGFGNDCVRHGRRRARFQGACSPEVLPPRVEARQVPPERHRFQWPRLRPHLCPHHPIHRTPLSLYHPILYCMCMHCNGLRFCDSTQLECLPYFQWLYCELGFAYQGLILWFIFSRWAGCIFVEYLFWSKIDEFDWNDKIIICSFSNVLCRSKNFLF